MFTVELRGDKELIARLDQMPERVRASLYNKVASLASILKTYIIDKKLSGQVLHHRSGDLWRSIHDEATQSANAVLGRVYSAGVPYAAIHEYGGKTSAHIIEAKTAQALRFEKGGEEIFAKSVNHPGSVMTERSYMRSSLADKKDEIIEGMNDAVMQGVNT